MILYIDYTYVDLGKLTLIYSKDSKILAIIPPIPKEYYDKVMESTIEFLKRRLCYKTLTIVNEKAPNFLLNPILRLWHSPRSIDNSTLLHLVDLNLFTSLELKVLQLVSKVPTGKVTTYSSLAKTLHTSARAIAKVLSMNPVPILVPCHRVIRKDGDVGGYLGFKELKWLKIYLLRREGVCTVGDRVIGRYFTDVSTLL